MPLARYFLYVGGALLALLFFVGAELPTSPAEQVIAADTAAELPTIRIHTDRKWPEKVVFDTSVPAGTGPVATTGAVKIDLAKANLVKTGTDGSALANASDSAAPDAPTKVRVREAFAQFQSTDPKQLQALDAKKPVLKHPVKRKVAKRRAYPPTMMIAQQPTFGFFGKNIW
jgi:hypothetical protein